MENLNTRDLSDELDNLTPAEDETLDSDDRERFEALTELQDAIGDSEFRAGLTLIHEDNFIEYAQQFANELCGASEELRWPFNCINWEAAADELQTDFTIAEFEGQTYYYQE